MSTPTLAMAKAIIALDEANLKIDLLKKEVDRLQYYKLHHQDLEPSIEQMGGWANFKYWITRHAVGYFRTCEVIDSQLEEANKTIAEVKKCAILYDSGERQYNMDDWDYINSRLDKYLTKYKEKV